MKTEEKKCENEEKEEKLNEKFKIAVYRHNFAFPRNNKEKKLREKFLCWWIKKSFFVLFLPWIIHTNLRLSRSLHGDDGASCLQLWVKMMVKRTEN